MTGAVAFTNNYSDLSTPTGYQFEFRCMRCGNGYQSRFRHSVTGFGGRLANLGGGILGGRVGEKLQDVGFDAEWLRDGWNTGGTTHGKRLAEAVEDVRPSFNQCHRCGQWVCKEICWNQDRGLCTDCAPRLDQEIAGLQAEAQRQQLRDLVQEQDWVGGIDVAEQRTGLCPSCHGEAGSGRFCQSCGGALAAATQARTQRRFCGGCGAPLDGSGVFCGGCGTPVL